ncbi:MAG: DUF3047 domain-containing protein [Victivallaceae bacterium]
MNITKITFTATVFFAVCLYLSTSEIFAPWREDFSRIKKKNDISSPLNWRNAIIKIGVSQTAFYVVNDKDIKSNKLIIEANKASGGLICNPSKEVDLNKTPILRWKWRVKNLPPGGDGRRPDKDDQALAIYIGFNDWGRKKSISYRYEADTPAGETGVVSYASGMVSVKWYCLRNKNDGTDKWYTEERNVAEDLKATFGVIPKEFALSVCANSQYTNSHTVAELNYLEFVPEQKK